MSNASARGATVLLVDDHPQTRRTLRQLLQDSGLQVVGEAANGREAVQQCEQLHPQVAVLDLSMPLLNGFEATRLIAKSCPDTRIIILTSHALKEYAKEAFRAGGVGFVTKEHAARDLLAAIEVVLEGKTYESGESAA